MQEATQRHIHMNRRSVQYPQGRAGKNIVVKSTTTYLPTSKNGYGIDIPGLKFLLVCVTF